MQKRYLEFVNNFENKMLAININDNYSNLVFLCVGTNKIIGDAIGPIIGDKLKCIENDFMKVYGTTQNTLNFSNAQEVIEKIYNDHKNPFLVTIDAALGNKKEVGNIFIGNGFIKLGNALEKNICFYSDITIKCVVGNYFLSKKQNLEELRNADFSDVLTMSKIVSNGIENVLKNFNIFV